MFESARHSLELNWRIAGSDPLSLECNNSNEPPERVRIRTINGRSSEQGWGERETSFITLDTHEFTAANSIILLQ